MSLKRKLIPQRNIKGCLNTRKCLSDVRENNHIGQTIVFLLLIVIEDL